MPTSFEVWIAQNLPLGETQTGLLDDPDGDGFNNLQEYAMGLDPANLSLLDVPKVSLDGNQLKLTYPRNLDAIDVTYEVRWSSDLNLWSDDGMTEAVVSDDGRIRVIEASVESSSEVAKFLRLSISKP